MQADAILSKKLFRPNLKTGEGRETLAAQEATRAKSCLGALRYLWRNSKDAAHHPKVAELKTYVRLSPTQQHRLDNPGADDSNFPAAIRDASAVGSGGDESDGTGHEGGGDSSSDFNDDEETLELGGGESEGDHREDIQPASTQEDDNGSNDGGSDSDDHEDGSKVIEERINPNDSDEFPDSQVSSNWLGKCYRDQKAYCNDYDDSSRVDKTCDVDSSDDGDDNDGDQQGASMVDMEKLRTGWMNDLKGELHEEKAIAETPVVVLRLKFLHLEFPLGLR